MQEKKEELKEEVEKEKVRSLNESIIKIRVELQKSNIKKSGKNNFAGFNYYELADFLPRLNELMFSENVNDRFFIKEDRAVLELQKNGEINTYEMPFVRFDTPVNTKYDKATGEVRKIKSMQDIQYLGALNTYYKRYLYINAFGITDGEIIDSMNNDDNIDEMTIEQAKDYVINFGKHKGKKLSEIPQNYLEWLDDQEKTEPRIKKAIELIFEDKNVPVLSKEEQDTKLRLLTRLNELVVQNGYDYDEILKHYKVNTTKDLTIEQLKNAIGTIINKLREKNDISPYDFMEGAKENE